MGLMTMKFLSLLGVMILFGTFLVASDANLDIIPVAPALTTGNVVPSDQQAKNAPVVSNVQDNAGKELVVKPSQQSVPVVPEQVTPMSAALQTSNLPAEKLVTEAPAIPMMQPVVSQPVHDPAQAFSSRRRLRGGDLIQPDIRKTGSDVHEQDSIDFTFDNTELEEMVRRYTEKKKMNVIFPPTGLKEKITFKPPHKLSMDEAKRYLYMFLDYAGYAVLPGQNFVVVAKSKEAQRSQLPLFVLGSGSKLNYKDLADSDEMIRAVYYLTTLKVENTPDNAVMALLKELLTSPDNAFIDTTLNGIIIADKSRVVKAALQLLSDLDATETKYIITTIQLFNASASEVVKIVNDILKKNQQSGGFGMDDKTSGGSGTYFSTSIRVVADARRNLLVIMGKEAPVNRLKDFIRERIDAPLASGKSIFHVYDLKYLDAATFADTLAAVVKSTGITDQVSADRTGGATRFFEGVSIKAETYQAAEGAKGADVLSGAGGGTVYRGGNRLLIAAQPSDWIQIKKLIDTLDVPQRQVIIEVLIADYTHARDRDISTRIRSPHAMVPLNMGGQVQTANDGNSDMITSPQTCQNTGGNPCNPGTNIVGDLMRIIGPGNTSELTDLAAGYTAVTFADGTGLINDGSSKGVWGLLTMLDQYGKLKILQHPYLISLNNTTATVSSKEIRRGTGDIPSSTGGALNVNIVDVSASLAVSITPRVASLDRVNLDIAIDISNYTSTNPSDYDRNTRNIKTNVNMAGKNQILVLGGLTRFDEEDTITETPLLSKIPLIGWLFRRKAKTRTELELGVFIQPTVIEPKIRETANKFTKGKVEDGAQGLLDDSPADKRDPIIRWFFTPEKTDNEVIKEFITETGFQEAATEKFDATLVAKTDVAKVAKAAKKS
jgi:general secretion pathway protein D